MFLLSIVAIVLVTDGCAAVRSPAEVALSIQAVNPREESQVIDVKCELPAGSVPSDVLSADGLRLERDDRSGALSLRGQCTLGPLGKKTFEVRMKEDVWFLPDEGFRDLRERTKRVAEVFRELQEDLKGSSVTVMSWILDQSCVATHLDLPRTTDGARVVNVVTNIISTVQARKYRTKNVLDASDIDLVLADYALIARVKKWLLATESLTGKYENEPEHTLEAWRAAAGREENSPFILLRVVRRNEASP